MERRDVAGHKGELTRVGEASSLCVIERSDQAMQRSDPPLIRFRFLPH